MNFQQMSHLSLAIIYEHIIDLSHNYYSKLIKVLTLSLISEKSFLEVIISTLIYGFFLGWQK